MKAISRTDAERLRKMGLLRPRKDGPNAEEPNFRVANKKHKSRAKTYCVVMDWTIMRALGYFKETNCQEITKEQYEKLMSVGLINEDEVQTYYKYVPKARAYTWIDGTYWIIKDYKLLNFLGIRLK